MVINEFKEGQNNNVGKKFGKEEESRSSPDGEIPLFSGKLKCGCCGHALYRDYKKREQKEYVYWLCGNSFII